MSTVTRELIRREAQGFARGNSLLSLSEQSTASRSVRATAEMLRQQGGPGTRVTVNAIEDAFTERVEQLMTSVGGSGVDGLYLSADELAAAASRDSTVTPILSMAYITAAGKGLDVDAVAAQRVGGGLDADSVFKTFTSTEEAMQFVDPQGRSVVWLVPVADGLLKKSFVAGRNDLWAQHFEVDRLDGEVSVTREH